MEFGLDRCYCSTSHRIAYKPTYHWRNTCRCCIRWQTAQWSAYRRRWWTAIRSIRQWCRADHQSASGWIGSRTSSTSDRGRSTSCRCSVMMRRLTRCRLSGLFSTSPSPHWTGPAARSTHSSRILPLSLSSLVFRPTLNRLRLHWPQLILTCI